MEVREQRLGLNALVGIKKGALAKFLDVTSRSG